MIYERVEEACDYLLEKAKEYHIDIKWKHFSPITPPGSSYEYRRVVMNLDWHNPKEFVFQLAHEMSFMETKAMFIITTPALLVKNLWNIRQTLELLSF